MSELFETTSYKALLSHELPQWRAEVERLEKEIAVKQAQRDAVKKKIEAAEVLTGVSGGDNRKAKKTMVDEIEGAMMDGIHRTPAEMRTMLVARGVPPEKVSSKSPGFYNAISRLHERTILVKEDDGSYVISPEVLKKKGGVFG